MYLAQSRQTALTSQEQSKQNNGQGVGPSNKGGFMMILHRIEKEMYGPGAKNLSASSLRVLGFIRHNIMRNWETEKTLKRKMIMKGTGLSERSVDIATKELEKERFLEVTRTQVNGLWKENTYRLHPKRFGNDLYPELENSTVVKIKEFKKRVKKAQKGSAEDCPTLPSTVTPGVAQTFTPQNEPNNTELLSNSSPKNPSLKEPYLK